MSVGQRIGCQVRKVRLGKKDRFFIELSVQISALES